LIDGTSRPSRRSSATAFLAGPHAALFVGLDAGARGAGISRASRGRSLTRLDHRSSSSMSRALITGARRSRRRLHALPFLIIDLRTALLVASFTGAASLIESPGSAALSSPSH